MKIRNFLIGYLAVIIFSACNEDTLNENISNISSDLLKISVKDQFSANATRANYTGFPATTFEEGDEIGVYAFNGTNYVASNVKYVKQSDGSWLADSDIRYDENYTYYAYFPYRATTYTPSTTGTVDAVDLKFANFINDASNYFWQADQSTKNGYTYSNLMIAKGNVTIDNGTPTVDFTLQHKRGLALFTEDVDLVEFTGNIPYEIGDTKQFLMKPDVLTDFEYDSNVCSLSAMNGGYTTHKVIKWNYNIDITAPEEFTYSGGTNSYSVSSYKTNKNNETVPIAWTAQFSDDGGTTWSDTPPSWLSAFTTSDDGGATPVNYNATVAAAASTSGSATTTAILRMKTPVTDMDLSDPTGIGTPQNTANCYVISAPGTYKLPLVYGNAIKNGNVNSAAYAHNFNSLENGITSPYMKDNNQSPNGAEVVWQDSYNNITNTNLSIIGDYLYFNVGSNIAEGNVLIGIKENDNIIWTYHIWITPVDWSNTSAYGVNNLAPTNVGWVNGGNLSYNGHLGRQCLVKFSQTGEGNEEQIIKITQRDDITVSGYSLDGYSPYYQWGRLTPFIPSTNILSLTRYPHTAYDGTGNVVNNRIQLIKSTTEADTDMKSKGELISKPLIIWTINKSNNSDYSNNLNNYVWNGNNNIKTVFDPCPPGFKVMALRTINGYFGSGKDWVLNNCCFTSKNNSNLYLPTCSFILAMTYNQNADIYTDQKTSRYWTSDPYYAEYITESFLGSGSSNYTNTSTSIYVLNGTYAYSIRGVIE